MDSSVVIGPIALPLRPLLLAAAAFAGHAVGTWLGRRRGLDAGPALWRLLLVTLAAARLGFVWTWREVYFDDPLAVLDLRDGGWDPAIGVVAAAFYGLALARKQPALRAALVAGGATTLVLWSAGTVALWSRLQQAVPLPALEVAALEGGSVDLRAFAGRPTVVNLWATWCPPCRREMPLLAAAQQRHPEAHFVFVNQGEDAAQVRRFLKLQQLALANVLLDDKRRLGAAYGERALPTTLFFDAHGRLQATHVGELSEAVIARRLGR